MHAPFTRQPRSAVMAYAAFLLATACAAVLLLMSHVSSQNLLSEDQTYVDVVVLEGDTLWHIARRHTQPGRDPRPVVELIRQANGLETALVRPGQVLKVPVP